MMAPVKIAATSYLNTIPFIYGIQRAFAKPSDLLLSSPRLCAEAYINKTVDIALVPTGIIPSLTDAKIITSYCLGANSTVRTVRLFSNLALDKITDIYLDLDSLTSVKLVRIICRELWKINPNFHDITNIDQCDSCLLIGDKVFEREDKFKYSYDLSQAWHTLTGLPFAFALWVAREGVSQSDIDSLDKALGYGVANINDAIAHYKYSNTDYAEQYLTKNIDYIFDNHKRTALKLFWEKSDKDNPPSSKG